MRFQCQCAREQVHEQYENLYFTRMKIYPVANETKNNQLNNLTINMNSQHVQHDEIGNT